jgi:hypothetical protein
VKMMWRSPIDGRSDLECNKSNWGASGRREKKRSWQGRGDKKSLPRCGGGDGE